MSDLDDLFNRLKAQNTSDSAQAPPQPSMWTQQPPQAGYQPPSVSSPLFSPPIQTPNPTHASNVISPASRMSPFAAPDAAQAQEQNRTNNLLNLLKFNGQSQGPMAGLQNVQAADQTQRPASAVHSRPSPGADLLASLQRKPSAQSAVPTSSGEKFESTANKAGTQDFLLSLLTKPNKAPSTAASRSGSNAATQKKADEAVVDQLAQSLADTAIKPVEQPKRDSTPARQFGSPSPEPSTFAAPQPSKAGLFNYVNPFDQLSSSSPLNRTPAPQDKKIEILKHDRGPSDSLNGDSGAPAAKTRKLSPEKEVAEHDSDGHAALRHSQSVSKKLEEVSETVQNEVEQALAAATHSAQPAKATETTEHPVPTIEKKAGDSTVESDWSTAEDEDAKQEEDNKVEVFNFPLKPFVTLQLTGSRAPRQFLSKTWEDHTPIARLKKDFSHDDRALATASQNHIVYAVVPSEKKPATGLKVIRQDDGNNKHLWGKSGERLCNLQVSSHSHADEEAILATGVNGTIFYTSLSSSAGDSFDDIDGEARGFVMSPPPNSEEASSASPFGTSSAIKTRVKLSNRHSHQYFAVARGRQIHLIAPEIVKEQGGYTDARTHKVDTEKYLSDHSASINTGKAGKDFCFSEDDTVLVSLDKVGKLKFWDIRELTSTLINGAVSTSHTELKDPTWGLTAGANPLNPDDKMSPSSVMFLDKDRACTKGIALRYMLVGFQQNHIIQLWDLGLSKCVQELRFPESAGSSNAMCSVTYHPKSSIICISHPGRNSVYFIHLSAPRYSMEPMSQATYIGKLARQDRSLPRPESTAIMSGMREYSLSKTGGELRSLEMLKTPFPTGDAPEDQTQFELYVMHSKGVIGLPIKKCDLGWDVKGKMVKPVDALQDGLIKVGDLNQPRPAATSESASTSQADAGPKPTPKIAKKDRETIKSEPKVQVKKEAANPSPSRAPAQAPPVSNGTTGSKPAEASMQVPEAPSATNPPIITPNSYAMAAQDSKPAAEPKVEKPAEAPRDAPSTALAATSTALAPAGPVSASADAGVSDLLAKEFGSLYQKLDQDKRVADAAGSARQDAMLRLISSTLTDNVESSLDRIVSTSIEKKVLPSLTSSTAKTIEKKLTESLNKQIGDSVSKEAKTAIPNAVSAALRDGQVTRALSTHIIDEVTKQVKMDMGSLVQRTMQTVQANMTTQVTQANQSLSKTVADTEARLSAHLRDAAQQQKQSNDMLAQLMAGMRDLTATVQNMKEEQAQILRNSTSSSSQDAVSTPASKAVAQSDEDAEVARLTQMLKAGDYQQATIDWLQSPRQSELFDNLFMYLNPLYLQQVSSLVALSVSATITSSFENNVDKRLEWLGTIITNIDQNDPDIRDVAPKIMDVLYQRLQGAYMMLAESPQRDEQVLKKTAGLTKQIGELRRVLG